MRVVYWSMPNKFPISTRLRFKLSYGEKSSSKTNHEKEIQFQVSKGWNVQRIKLWANYRLFDRSSEKGDESCVVNFEVIWEIRTWIQLKEEFWGLNLGWFSHRYIPIHCILFTSFTFFLLPIFSQPLAFLPSRAAVQPSPTNSLRSKFHHDLLYLLVQSLLRFTHSRASSTSSSSPLMSILSC